MLAANRVSPSGQIALLDDALDWTIGLLSRYFDTDTVIVDGAVRLSSWKSWIDDRTRAQLCCFNPDCRTSQDTNLTIAEAARVDNFMGRHFTCAKFFQASHQAVIPTAENRLALENFYPPLLLQLAYQLKEFGYSDTGGAIFRMNGTPAYSLLFQFGGPWGAIQALLVFDPKKNAR